MKQALATVSLLVPSYDAGLRFYVDVLGFRLVEDTQLGGGRRRRGLLGLRRSGLSGRDGGLALYGGTADAHCSATGDHRCDGGYLHRG